MLKTKRSGVIKLFLGRLWLRITGWELKADQPPHGNFLLICAPHTSNWDFGYLLAFMFIRRIEVSWMGKHTLFKKPFGTFMKWLGGIPVDRRKTHGVVDQIADHFQSRENLIIAIAPEGTRRKTDHWKSGFYHIALRAKVPLLLGYLDYVNKIVGTGPIFTPTGNIKYDMDVIRDFYKDFRGAHPEDESDITLREELSRG
jgi:1-acyl-sn-glycerol-3-phosphate acyltransferase